MDAKEAAVENGAQRKGIKAQHQRVVQSKAVLVLAFLFEIEKSGEVPAFVISAQQKHGIGTMQLERQQIQSHFAGEIPSINIITKKQILRILVQWISPNIKELQQIVILPMDITTHSDRILQSENVGLSFEENFCSTDDGQSSFLTDASLTEKVVLEKWHSGQILHFAIFARLLRKDLAHLQHL